MKGYFAFVKKEFLENIMNFRFFILFAVFLVFGIMSAFLAKFTPDILSALAADMKMTNAPLALDSWEQFYKNISGVGFSAVIILFGSCMANEYSKGTLVLMVTKGLSRSAVILSKYTVSIILMTVSYWVSFGAAYGYTAYLWPNTKLPNIVFAAFALWVIGFLYLSITMLGCVIFKQTFTSVLFCGAIAAIISLLGMIKQFSKFSPMILTTKNTDLIAGNISPSYFIGPMIVSIILTIIFMVLSIKTFNKKQL